MCVQDRKGSGSYITFSAYHTNSFATQFTVVYDQWLLNMSNKYEIWYILWTSTYGYTKNYIGNQNKSSISLHNYFRYVMHALYFTFYESIFII